MLADHLLQLFFTILTKRRLVDKTFVCITSRAHKRYLRPRHYSIPIHQIIHISSLWIMGQPNGIHPHLKHQPGIFFMVHRMECISHLRPFLMAAYPMQRQMFPIKKETLIGICRIITKSQWLFHFIYLFSILHEGYHGLIHKRIFSTIP